jgi:hypothetical protein
MRPFRSALLLAVALSFVVIAAINAAGPRYTGWETPVRLTSVEAPGYLTLSPFLSKDGSRLYLGSNRPGGSGAIDLWVSAWNELTDEWTSPVNLGAVVNSPGSEWYPSLSRDEHWLFFMSNRAGGYGGYDLWAAYRASVHDDLGWEPPVNLGPVVNTSGDEASPSYFANDAFGLPQLFFTSNRGAGNSDLDIFVAEIAGSLDVLPPVAVAELNSMRSLPAAKGLEISVSVRHDGLEAFMTSNRPGSVEDGLDIWVSTRSSPSAPWQPPVNAGSAINTGATERDAMISADRLSLLFKSGEGIYQARREMVRQP